MQATDLHRHHIDHVTIPSPRGPEFGVLKRVEDVSFSIPIIIFQLSLTEAMYRVIEVVCK
jgi:hypothetical protein